MIAVRGAYALYRTRTGRAIGGWNKNRGELLGVTINERHMQNIMRLVDELTAGKGCSYLLFKTISSLSSFEKAQPP